MDFYNDENHRPSGGVSPEGVEERNMHAFAVFKSGEPPYFSSTFAPASSSCFLIFAASSLLTSAFTSFGAPSTRSLASLRPRPVIARISLITLIFLSPASARTTVYSVFSAAGAAAAAAGAAAATGAAADTPHLSSRSFARSAASRTVRPDKSSTSFSIFDICFIPYGFERLVVLLVAYAASLVEYAPMTRASCPAGAANRPASFVAGACNSPTILPLSSSSDGSSARAFTPFASSAVDPTTPPRI